MVKARPESVLRGNRRWPTPKLDRLTAFLETHPKALQTHTLAHIAREIGATRQFVQLHLPGVAAKQRQRVREADHKKIRAFLRRNPSALAPLQQGGIAMSKIAEAVGVSHSRLLVILREMKLRRRTPTKRERREALREMKVKRAEDQRALLRKVLRIESCEICGTGFPWTGQKERNRRRYDAPVSCSRKCSNEYYNQLGSRSRERKP